MATAVFHPEHVALPALPAGFTAVLLPHATALAVVEATVASGDFRRYVNCCSAGRGAPPSQGPCGADVAACLRQAGADVVGGVPARQQDYTRVDARVSAFYSELRVAPYRVVTRADFAAAGSPAAAAAKAVTAIAFPVRVTPAPLVGSGRHRLADAATCPDVAAVEAALSRAFAAPAAGGLGAAKLIVEAAPPAGRPEVAVLCYGNTPHLATSAAAIPPSAVLPSTAVKVVCSAVTGDDADSTQLRAALANEAFVGQCREFFKTFCGSAGWCLLRFAWALEAAPVAVGDDSPALQPSEPRLQFVEAEPGCDVLAPPGDATGDATHAVVASLLAAHGIAAAAFLEAVVAPVPQPAWDLAFDPAQQGFFLLASRDIAEGEVVFPDEGTAMPLVTKPFVAQQWSELDRDTFTRYAWPIEQTGHVYCVWQDDPRTWRPINHSCNPSLEFGKGHSFNHTARRALKKGDALTLDYTTFCDFTMAPFDCFCGESTCRKRITPDAKVLAEYGDRAWHRAPPPADRNAV